MKWQTLFSAAIFGMACFASAGTEPATRPANSVGDVDSNFSARAVVAKREYDAEMAKAADERINSLQSLKDRAVKEEDLDQAISIKKRIDDLKGASGGEEVNSAEALHNFLLTKMCGNTSFLPNGLVRDPGWDGRGLVTSWEAVDRRTVIMRIERGRSDNKTAVLMFSEGLKRSHSIDFEGHNYDWSDVTDAK
jgi:hypothetical protein